MDIVAPPARWRSESQEIGGFYKFLKAEVERLNEAENNLSTQAMRQTNLILREDVSPNPYIQKMYFEHQMKKRLGDSKYPQAFRPSEPRLQFPSAVWGSSVKPEKDEVAERCSSRATEDSRTESRVESQSGSHLSGPALEEIGSPKPARYKLPEPEPISYRIPEKKSNSGPLDFGRPKSNNNGPVQSSNFGRSQGRNNGQSNSNGPLQRSSLGRAQSSSNGRAQGTSNNNERPQSFNTGRINHGRSSQSNNNNNNISNDRSTPSNGDDSRRLDRMNAFREFSGDDEYGKSGIFYKVGRSRSGARFYG
ncbi:putative uncharacterized protein DDB_G0277255 [Selaginella moellendorffii]|uniref:putative uncharacterized protein DDB_G0277255 n=1 Tax=Selaginella moellendorffii TaxID=88036 RepID=UPI000D1CEA91|nr:putative uncharacterized protein DDB_G0277255 [Selaginella moellendorffii]|eukprot:XP_024534677.1 putative uncharacterized protein DDB_G0277255 [Selaginella moellendorffii]